MEGFQQDEATDPAWPGQVLVLPRKEFKGGCALSKSPGTVYEHNQLGKLKVHSQGSKNGQVQSLCLPLFSCTLCTLIRSG